MPAIDPSTHRITLSDGTVWARVSLAAVARGISIVELCEWREKWRGESCREAWPVSKFAWCAECRAA